MASKVTRVQCNDFLWVDVYDPTKKFLQELSDEFHFSASTIKDSLKPEHLPKVEFLADRTFLVTRIYDENQKTDADDVQELTRKIVFFWGPGLIVTVHRKEIKFVTELCQRAQQDPGLSKTQVLSELLWSCVNSFEAPIQKAMAEFDALEHEIFKMSETGASLEKSYYLKRRTSVFRRILKLTQDTFYKLQDKKDTDTPLPTKSLNNEISHQLFYTEELVENIHNALSLQISLSSQKTNKASHETNEVMRVLTILSVFLMPLNLIAGIYGMNFHNIPELNWKYGYVFALSLMVVFSTVTYFQFKKRGWIR